MLETNSELNAESCFRQRKLESRYISVMNYLFDVVGSTGAWLMYVRYAGKIAHNFPSVSHPQVKQRLQLNRMKKWKKKKKKENFWKKQKKKTKYSRSI